MQYFLFILTLVFYYSNPSYKNLPDIASQPVFDSLRIIRGPYLQSGTQTGIIIRWRTNIPSSSLVSYGKTYENLNFTVEDEKDTTEHIIYISGLQPDVKYYYAVGNSSKMLIDGDSSFYFVTAPKEGGNKKIRIWVISDFGTADSTPREVKEAYLKYMQGKHTDVWLMLGDIAYMHGTDVQYQKALFDNMFEDVFRNTVAWPAFGNHDARNADSQTQSGPYYDIFSLPVNGEAGGVPSGTEAYYSFDYGNIHIVSLDSEDTPLDKESEMLKWLDNDLKANHSEWTIVIVHHPPYTKGTHNSDMHWDSGGRMLHVRENVLPILDAHGVDLVLSGHSHVYERSYLIANHYGHAKTFKTKAMIVNPNGKRKKYPSAYVKSDRDPGAIYVVCGVGGSRPTGGHFGHPAMAYSSDQYRGSLVIEVDENKLYAVFLDTQGKVRDWFRIEKQDKPLTSSPAFSR